MEYNPGGDLLFHLIQQGKFLPKQCQLYSAEITLGLIYLHKNKIIHRWECSFKPSIYL